MMSAMMHLPMMALAVIMAIIIRLLSISTDQTTDQTPSSKSPAKLRFFQIKPCQDNWQQTWQNRWAKSLSAFIVPPTFLLMTATAIVIMGPSSCHAWEGWLSYELSIGFLLLAGLSWIYLGWIGFVSQQTIRRSPTKIIATSFGNITSHILNIPFVFSAQVGCWNPRLVVSQGLLEMLDETQLSAVIAHETGHAHYQDTFWFWWLGGLRRLTFWLPGTDYLWQELLLLREMRADRWATQHVDKLVLAESLMQVVAKQATARSISKASRFAPTIAANFSCPTSIDRLSQRIDAILAEDGAVLTHNSDDAQGNQWIADWSSSWISIGWSLTPLLTIPLHH